MQEAFLYYLWQSRNLGGIRLTTTQGEALTVLETGKRNLSGGPDFEGAWLRCGNLRWSGSVEMHLRSSDWYAHKHHHDPAYRNVILHVVWVHNAPVYYPDGSEIPVLELQGQADAELVTNYTKLLASKSVIACRNRFDTVSRLGRFSLLDAALAERLYRRGLEIAELYRKNGEDWEQTCYQTVAAALGQSLNKAPMQELAARLPLRYLKQLHYPLARLQALLLGQAGLLETSEPGLPGSAFTELYNQLKSEKAGLGPELPSVTWKTGRIRPGALPRQRILLLAEWVYNLPSFSGLLLQAAPANVYIRALKKAAATQAGLAGAVQQVLINAVAPLLMAYGLVQQNNAWAEQALTLLEALPPEDNHITREWTQVGLSMHSAADSQGALEQYHNRCARRQCLQCPAGKQLLGRQHETENDANEKYRRTA